MFYKAEWKGEGSPDGCPKVLWAPFRREVFLEPAVLLFAPSRSRLRQKLYFNDSCNCRMVFALVMMPNVVGLW